MGTWLPWVIWLVGGTIALQGAVLVVWALRHDKAKGRRRCPKCWYDMSGTAAAEDGSFVCSECGRRTLAERGLLRTRRRWRRAVLGLLVFVVGLGVIFQAELRAVKWWHRAPTYVLIKLIPYAPRLPENYRWEFDSRVFNNSYRHSAEVDYRFAPLSEGQRTSLAHSALATLKSNPTPRGENNWSNVLGYQAAKRQRSKPCSFRC